MPELKNYNIFALRGDNQTTDQDVCDTLGLDPALANTPGINDAAIKKMHRENYVGFIAKGIDEKKALQLADNNAESARKEVNTLMKQK